MGQQLEILTEVDCWQHRMWSRLLVSRFYPLFRGAFRSHAAHELVRPLPEFASREAVTSYAPFGLEWYLRIKDLS